MLDKGTLVTVNGGVNGITTRLSANVTVQAKPEVAVTPSPASQTTTGTLLDGNPIWRKQAQTNTDAPDIIDLPTVDTVTVVKELGCLPGPEFYGSCPAVSVTH
jgi:hypothetical protein